MLDVCYFYQDRKIYQGLLLSFTIHIQKYIVVDNIVGQPKLVFKCFQSLSFLIFLQFCWFVFAANFSNSSAFKMISTMQANNIWQMIQLTNDWKIWLKKLLLRLEKILKINHPKYEILKSYDCIKIWIFFFNHKVKGKVKWPVYEKRPLNIIH